jgi:hypothetical protein
MLVSTSLPFLAIYSVRDLAGMTILEASRIIMDFSYSFLVTRGPVTEWQGDHIN